jgi:hypothetical protein
MPGPGETQAAYRLKSTHKAEQPDAHLRVDGLQFNTCSPELS